MKNAVARLTHLSTTLLILGVALLSGRAFAQTSLTWRTAVYYDTGRQPTIALLPSGLAVEFHQSQNNSSLWYHVGKLAQTGNGTYLIQWGESHSLNYDGHLPDIAITKEGYLLLVYTKYAYSGYGSEVQMRYWVGQIDPAGDTRQTITWRLKDGFFDTGLHAKLAFTSSNVLVEVHEAQHTPRIFYRVGHFRNPADKDFNLVWDSGNGGTHYDNGANPSISIDNNNRILECHQAKPSDSRLFYHRGILDGNAITFDRSVPYDNDSKNPDVVLTGTGQALEIASRNQAPFSRTGILNVNDPERVDWSNAVSLGRSGRETPYPSIATNSTLAVAAWNVDDWLYYSVAPVR